MAAFEKVVEPVDVELLVMGLLAVGTDKATESACC